tara:strand:- start:1814 stop:3475 length:1662 start_codon:yes stop_codon:yes gene_type:complete
MEFRIAEKIKLSAQVSLILVLNALSFNLTAQTSIDDERITFVRLTAEQYRNSIRDIFGDSIEITGNAIAAGVREAGLMAVGGRRLTLSSSEVESYEVLALDVASQVMSPSRRNTLIPCRPENENVFDGDCTREFISTVGFHLFRRSLSEYEIGSYSAMASKATESLGGFYIGLQAALVGMMVSPDFLFRIERSVPSQETPGIRRLDAWSRASRLSFFLWNTTPSPALLQAAQSGELMFEAGLDEQVQQMIASPRIEDGLRAFFSDMLAFDRFDTLDIDTTLYPKFTKNVEDEAREQTLRTIADHLLEQDVDYRDLFDSRKTFLTPALAALYGVPISIRQEMGGLVPWVPYEYPEDHIRVGLLGQATFLSLFSHPGASSPTLRGKAVREHLLCQTIPPPPGDVDFSLVRDTDNPEFRTARDRLTEHRNNPTCAGCHTLMDPIGLALEIFDASGVFRNMENGALIDTSGQWLGQEYSDARELTLMLKKDPTLTSCLVQRAYNYGTAREPTPSEVQWLNSTHSQLRQEGVYWRELLQRISENPDFYTVPEAAPKEN